MSLRSVSRFKFKFWQTHITGHFFFGFCRWENNALFYEGDKKIAKYFLLFRVSDSVRPTTREQWRATERRGSVSHGDLKGGGRGANLVASRVRYSSAVEAVDEHFDYVKRRDRLRSSRLQIGSCDAVRSIYRGGRAGINYQDPGLLEAPSSVLVYQKK